MCEHYESALQITAVNTQYHGFKNTGQEDQYFYVVTRQLGKHYHSESKNKRLAI